MGPIMTIQPLRTERLEDVGDRCASGSKCRIGEESGEDEADGRWDDKIGQGDNVYWVRAEGWKSLKKARGIDTFMR